MHVTVVPGHPVPVDVSTLAERHVELDIEEVHSNTSANHLRPTTGYNCLAMSSFKDKLSMPALFRREPLLLPLLLILATMYVHLSRHQLSQL